MQKLSKAAIGRSYTIQWMFGVPEVMDFLREHHVEELFFPGRVMTLCPKASTAPDSCTSI